MKISTISMFPRSGPLRVCLPPQLTGTSYSVWLAARQEAARQELQELGRSRWLAPCSQEAGRGATSLGDQVRAGLLRAGSVASGGDMEVDSGWNATEVLSAEARVEVVTLADSVRRGLLLARGDIEAVTEATPRAEARVEVETPADSLKRGLQQVTSAWLQQDGVMEEEDDDESIVTLDTAPDTDTSLDMDNFDVLEDAGDLSMWIAKS